MYKSNRKKIHKYAEKKRLLTLVSIYLVLKTFLSKEKRPEGEMQEKRSRSSKNQ